MLNTQQDQQSSPNSGQSPQSTRRNEGIIQPPRLVISRSSNSEGGDERPSILSARFWKFQNFAHYSFMSVPDKLKEDEENPFKKVSEKKDVKTSKQNASENADELPPGFRWVTIEIV